MTNQRRFIFGARAAQGALVGALCLAAPAAHAACPSASAADACCSSLTHPVYVAGSTAQKTYIGGLAAALQHLPTPIHLVYSGQGSCVGAAFMTVSPSNPVSGKGSTFDPATGKDDGVGCNLDDLGNPVDVGLSDVWATSCSGPTVTVASDVVDFHGPIQAMNFVVPTGAGGSTQTSISHDAAYLTFGLGNAGNAAPWTDYTAHEVRGSTSGTMIMTSSVIGVPATQWWGNADASGTAVASALLKDATTNGNGAAAIGIMSSSDANANRATVRQLAYQHTGQTCAYTPDSDSTKAFDMQNVRDGQYMIWGPSHLLVHTTNGVPTNPDVATMVDTLSGKAPAPGGIDLIHIEATNGVVPDCAMRATRNTEGGDIMSYFPAEGSCTCKFLVEATQTKPADCTTCTTNADCKNVSTPDGTVKQGSCNNIISGTGYCEVQ